MPVRKSSIAVLSSRLEFQQLLAVIRGEPFSHWAVMAYAR
jgi:hypothetical protein